jgi:hypothetical protein
MAGLAFCGDCKPRNRVRRAIGMVSPSKHRDLKGFLFNTFPFRSNDIE